MKNDLYKKFIILLFFVLIMPPVQADENINDFEFGSPISVIDNVENRTGQACISCNCNFTVYNIRNHTVNYSRIMSHKGNGIYNVTVPYQLSINRNDTIYPVLISCNDGHGGNGISSIKGIRINDKMFDFSAFTIILMVIPFFLAFIGFKLEPSNNGRVWVKWIFLGTALFMIIGALFFALIISLESGIAGLPGYFEGMLWIFGILVTFFLFYLLYEIIAGKQGALTKI